MIKVLHILTDSNIGGAGHTLLALFDRENGIDRNEFDITVAVPINAKIKPDLDNLGINCIELPHLAERSFSSKAIKVLLAEMKKLKPQIVHTHASLSGRIAARRYGKCKIVHTRHSVFDVPGWKKKFPVKQLHGVANNCLSDAIIAVSPAAESNLRDLGTRKKKIHVIYNGTAPMREFSPTEIAAFREKYGIPDNAFVLAQIARLTKVKGHDYVLDAIKNLPNVYVLMAGAGELRPHLEARIKNEGITNAKLLGFVTETEEIFAVMDVQLSASYGTEATSLALLQGMSIGKPAIVTNFGGNPYVITHNENGLLIPTCNSHALELAISLLMNDPELQKNISEKARKIYAERFTVDEMVQKTQRLYKDLL